MRKNKTRTMRKQTFYGGTLGSYSTMTPEQKEEQQRMFNDYDRQQAEEYNRQYNQMILNQTRKEEARRMRMEKELQDYLAKKSVVSRANNVRTRRPLEKFAQYKSRSKSKKSMSL
jgi:hypothetical protein